MVFVQMDDEILLLDFDPFDVLVVEHRFDEGLVVMRVLYRSLIDGNNLSDWKCYVVEVQHVAALLWSFF